jgi:Xaa-Pro aminopeptidase
MLGLDVHDMEGMGEDFVGYDDNIGRSAQFGLSSLRMARKLEQGFVVTDEPGIYFIPLLIDKWKAEKRFESFINYEKVEHYKNFGGVRIEDDLLITSNGCKVLGKPIPKTAKEIEDMLN